jgi:hypothetical protein
MFTLTISGSTLEELFSNLETTFRTKPNADFTQTPQAAVPFPNNPAATPPAPAASAAVPVAAPAYTLEQLARAGAALAQAGKMDLARALLAKYNVQTVNQLNPDQYGAFATELRALGAQL